MMETEEGANSTKVFTDVSIGSDITLLLATHLYKASWSVMFALKSKVAKA